MSQRNKNKKRSRPSAGKKVVARSMPPKEKAKRRLSTRFRMRANIRRAQMDTVPVLKRKALPAILRLARAYMIDYREDPRISRTAAEVLIQDMDMYIHRMVSEACTRANLGMSSGVATLSRKHVLAVMNEKDGFRRRSREPCYMPQEAIDDDDEP